MQTFNHFVNFFGREKCEQEIVNDENQELEKSICEPACRRLQFKRPIGASAATDQIARLNWSLAHGFVINYKRWIWSVCEWRNSR